MTPIYKVVLTTVLVILLLFQSELYSDTFIRVNQVGYLPDDPKTAVIMSTEPIANKPLELLNVKGQIVQLEKSTLKSGPYLAFPHHSVVDFSEFITEGKYRLRIESALSPWFQIGKTVYHSIPDSLLRFFQVQRCGRTEPLYHEPCHLSDGRQIRGLAGSNKSFDLTGGWHDAGDYIKFLITTSHTVYLLLLTYDMNPNYFSTDHNENGLPDILDEAQIGLDWMMKMHINPGELLTQVQDQRDHDVGWRLPENDPLTGDRPAYHLPSRSICGSFSSAMAMAATVFSKIGNKEYSVECMRHAEQVYLMIKTDLPETSTGPDSMYLDKNGWDNSALAAIELFNLTGDSIYLNEAVEFTEDAPPVHWFSWGDLSALAYARMAPHHSLSLRRLESSLDYYKGISEENPFGYPLEHYPWGSASVQLGVAILSILHSTLTDSGSYLELAVNQRDFMLGKNSHGVSFLTGFGTDYPQNLHHQILYLKGIALAGALVEGLVARDRYIDKHIPIDATDRFAAFQSSEAVYYDDRLDYLCNEPTISLNAQALFVFGWFAAKGQIR